MNRVRVLIVDDHVVVVEGLVRLLSFDKMIEVVGRAASLSEAKTLMQRVEPDVILLDVLLPDSKDLSSIGVLKAIQPHVKVIVLTGQGKAIRGAAVRAGADGFLTKELASDVIAQRIAEIAAGSPQHDEQELTQREIDVCRLVAEGLTNEEIAQSLVLSVNTVKTHLASALRKLGLRDRVAVAVYWTTRLMGPAPTEHSKDDSDSR